MPHSIPSSVFGSFKLTPIIAIIHVKDQLKDTCALHADEKYYCQMKTAILSWLQNDGNRGFSKDQLKGKQLSPTFRPDALVVFRAKVKLGVNCKSCFPLSWSLENPLFPSLLSNACLPNDKVQMPAKLTACVLT